MTEGLQSRLVMGDDALFELLASEVSLGIGSQDPRYRRALGRAWFESHLVQLRSIICGHPSVAQFVSLPTDTAALASAMADLLAVALSAPAVYTVAVLASRYGIARICGTEQ